MIPLSTDYAPMPQQSDFRRRYREGLHTHLLDAANATTLEFAPDRARAERLGEDARALSMSTLGLVRVHEEAVTALETSKRSSVPRDELDLEAERYFDQVFERVGTNGDAGGQEAGGQDARRARDLRRALAVSRAEGKELRAEALRTAERLRVVTQRLLTAHEDERSRISRDLHDELGQNLTAVNLALATLKRAAAADAKELGRNIARSQQLLLRAMKKVRVFAFELRPPLLDHLGLVPALRTLAGTVERSCRLDIRFSTDNETLELSGERATALYRVAQEALTNVRRHARAKTVVLTLRTLPNEMQMEIHDDGKSFNASKVTPNSSGGLGLLCMQERMQLVGGTLEIESTPGHGTRVLARVPDIEVVDDG